MNSDTSTSSTNVDKIAIVPGICSGIENSGTYYMANTRSGPTVWRLHDDMTSIAVWAGGLYNLTGSFATKSGGTQNCFLINMGADLWITAVQRGAATVYPISHFVNFPGDIKSLELNGDNVNGYTGYYWDVNYTKIPVTLTPLRQEQLSLTEGSETQLLANAGPDPRTWDFNVQFKMVNVASGNNLKEMSGILITEDNSKYTCKLEYTATNQWSVSIKSELESEPNWKDFDVWTMPEKIQSMMLSHNDGAGYSGYIFHPTYNIVNITLTPIPVSLPSSSIAPNYNGVYILDMQANVIFSDSGMLWNPQLVKPTPSALSGACAVDKTNKWIYSSPYNYVCKFDFNGGNLSFLETGPVCSMAIDEQTGNVWFGQAPMPGETATSAILIYNADGKYLKTLNIAGNAMAYDAANHVFWVANSNGLMKLDADGTLMGTWELGTPKGTSINAKSVVLDPEAQTVWVAFDCIAGTFPNYSCPVVTIFDTQGSYVTQFIVRESGGLANDVTREQKIEWIGDNLPIINANILSMSPSAVSGEMFISTYRSNNGVYSYACSTICNNTGQSLQFTGHAPGLTFDAEGNEWEFTNIWTSFSYLRVQQGAFKYKLLPQSAGSISTEVVASNSTIAAQNALTSKTLYLKA